jgi:hypothetical protein
VLLIAVVTVVVLGAVTLFVGDWRGISEGAVRVQSRVRRWVLAAVIVLVVAFLALAFFGGFATI